MKGKLDLRQAIISEIVRSRPTIYKLELLELKNVTELKSILDGICEGRI